MDFLSFGRGNAKLADNIVTFSIPSGYTCPGASQCLAWANRKNGKITDGTFSKFRCYSASQEALMRNVRTSRWNNLELLNGKTRAQMAGLLHYSLPAGDIIRVHVSGDFFNQDYFDAWMDVARKNPGKLFYAYTKSLLFWVKRLKTIPANFKLTASYGGKFDGLIEKHNLKSCQVVLSPYEARKKKLKIDKTDSLAYSGKKSFALLIHGTQAAFSAASIAWQKLRGTKHGGYGKTNLTKAFNK